MIKQQNKVVRLTVKDGLLVPSMGNGVVVRSCLGCPCLVGFAKTYVECSAPADAKCSEREGLKMRD